MNTLQRLNAVLSQYDNPVRVDDHDGFALYVALCVEGDTVYYALGGGLHGDSDAVWELQNAGHLAETVIDLELGYISTVDWGPQITTSREKFDFETPNRAPRTP